MLNKFVTFAKSREFRAQIIRDPCQLLYWKILYLHNKPVALYRINNSCNIPQRKIWVIFNMELWIILYAYTINIISRGKSMQKRGTIFIAVSSIKQTNNFLTKCFYFFFADEARQNGANILVHCHAGVSRSATITIAYLLKHSKLSMMDIYRLVKAKRNIISPNFNFMGQLMEYEQALNNGLCERSVIPNVIPEESSVWRHCSWTKRLGFPLYCFCFKAFWVSRETESECLISMKESTKYFHLCNKYGPNTGQYSWCEYQKHSNDRFIIIATWPWGHLKEIQHILCSETYILGKRGREGEFD